jgi:hypothetical protein
MTGRIALLGWGSLLWGGDVFDAWHEPWLMDGPVMKIEFSRVSASRSGALTLVIDTENGAPVRVAWALSRRSTIAQAVEDLRRREGTTERYIGRITMETEAHYRPEAALETIRGWASARRVEGVVWTDLPSNFAEKTGLPFSVAAAVGYLERLDGDSRAKALEYIRRAPAFVRTPLRDAVEALPAWPAVSAAGNNAG